LSFCGCTLVALSSERIAAAASASTVLI